MSRRIPILVPAFLAALGLGASAGAQSLEPKQVAAPAADILAGIVRLPEPGEHPVRSRAALVPVQLEWVEGTGWRFEARLPVEADGALSLAALSPDAASWRLSVAPPGEPLAGVLAHARLGPVERRSQVLSSDLPGWVVDRYDIARARAGWWTVRVDVPGARPDLRPQGGWLVAASPSALRVEAWTTTAMLLADERIGVAARLSGATAQTRVERAELLLETATGASRLDLRDDGEHEDGEARDGIYGALLPAWTSGEVRARVELAGLAPSGAPFLRTVQLGFPVLERRLALTGAVSTHVEDADRLRLEIEAWPLGPPARLQVSAEVWGRGPDGAPRPVCWLSRIAAPLVRGDAWILPLWLDGRWLDLAGARPPLELRAVRVQDPDTHVPFDRLERVTLPAGPLPAVVGRGQSEVTREMLTGTLAASAGGTTPVGPHGAAAHVPYPRALMLVHGYCSSGNIWPPTDFTQPKLEFLDPNQNRTHDQFAQLLAQKAQTAGLASFGVVSHSQGGAAALHLLTYYQSGLDRAVGERIVQSVATPYQGTPLASLGGFACGTNPDMTPSGAAAWLAGIPSWARAEVWYWTTSDAGSACNFLTSLLLADPEDGTVERDRGQLPGGNSMGHVTGWCHTTGMSYPASYTDHARNQAMDAAAAR